MRHAFYLIALAALPLSNCREAPPPQPKQEAPKTKAEAPAEALNLLDRSEAGKPAPTTAFLGPDGKRMTLAAFRGKPLLVNLWATWCAPCVTEIPHLDALAARETGLQVVTISQDRGKEGKALVDAFFKKKKFALLKASDPESALSDAFTVNSMPTTILYDSDGKEVWRLMGPEDWTSKKAGALIGEAS